VRLTADCPLMDPDVVTAVIGLRVERGADYACNVLPRTFPRGLDVEVMTADALRTAHAEADDPAEREHVTPFLYRRPERFRLANLRSGLALGRERWTVDTPEDLEFIRHVAASMPTPLFSWRDVLAAVGINAHPQPGVVTLRPADERDGDRILAWRNERDAVVNSESGTAVAEADHRRWFGARLDDPATKLWIGEVDDVPIGMVRVDVRSGVGTVSVAVDGSRRGEGVGSRLLGALVDELRGDVQVTALEARIRPENVASIKAFERNGFVQSGTDGAVLVFRR
jgi:RimJ/RimL family protein N-acetyltransferase